MKLNVPEFTVSEFSSSIKRVVEDSFGYVRIKGEITGFKRAASGHLYFTLKDQNAGLSSVVFRNAAQMVQFEIADGLQVCASGRITTFEGRSNYQIIIDKLEIAGFGAILEMIEKRRKKLLSEGLFEDIHKQPLPFFPKTIGVITSATGAVIEDIKHRIADRCPTHIMLYPTLVQGDRAAAEIIAGIKFFNRMAREKRPNLLIIARGGGSFEDLMPFNDESLVREVFKSEIPIISAIGHETDTSLIDYVSDLRAPTPTAAAEIATPLLSELKGRVSFLEERLESLPKRFLELNLQNLKNLQRYIADPAKTLEQINDRFYQFSKKFNFLLGNNFDKKLNKLSSIQISHKSILQKINLVDNKLEFASQRLDLGVKNILKESESNLNNLTKLLKANHYDQVLKRGFAMVKNKNGNLISSISDAKLSKEISIKMHDGELELTDYQSKLKC